MTVAVATRSRAHLHECRDEPVFVFFLLAPWLLCVGRHHCHFEHPCQVPPACITNIDWYTFIVLKIDDHRLCQLLRIVDLRSDELDWVCVSGTIDAHSGGDYNTDGDDDVVVGPDRGSPVPPQP